MFLSPVRLGLVPPDHTSEEVLTPHQSSCVKSCGCVTLNTPTSYAPWSGLLGLGHRSKKGHSRRTVPTHV